MFSREFRLKTGEFDQKNGRKIITPHFFVRFSKNKTGHNRYAVAAGAKFEKSSVKRHYWKRRLLEGLEKWPSLGLDVVVALQKKAKELGAAEAKKELGEIYKKIKIQ